ncbi:MAG: hypothetical protein QOJ84_716 [Bradyrhizobium sp.]|jgi:hypothetical protein|nr:hypothetical protein [Bradyrhizobium sp.]
MCDGLIWRTRASNAFDMKTLMTTLAALIWFAAASGTCNAQTVVKTEPLDMRNGATVLVDDGSCGKGMIKRLTVTHGNPMSGAPQRETKCIPK